MIKLFHSLGMTALLNCFKTEMILRYHRGIVVQWLNDASKELSFTSEMLLRDSKNYHCWQHRQLILNHFNLWKDEVNFTTDFIVQDCRNNSAWNQRYYAYVNTTGFIDSVVENEVRLVIIIFISI